MPQNFWNLVIPPSPHLMSKRRLNKTASKLLNSEHLPVFRAPREGKGRSAPVHGQETLRPGPRKKLHERGTNNTQTHKQTVGRFSEKSGNLREKICDEKSPSIIYQFAQIRTNKKNGSWQFFFFLYSGFSHSVLH